MITEISINYGENIPDAKDMVLGIIYVSSKYNTAIHLCACGCGNEVVTPLGVGGWMSLSSDVNAMTLRPSIGNWNFDCQSHYYITNNKIEWL